jgi:hypothetical protein
LDDSVQIDLADMEEYTQYRDKSCQELEGILTKDSRFEGCIVKRVRMEKTAPELKDPFDIQSVDGEHIAWFYEWEMNTLDGPEILSYLDVERRKEQKLDTHLFWEMVSFAIIFFGVVAVIIDVGFILLGLGAQAAINFFPVTLLVLLSGLVLGFVSRGRRLSSVRNLDINSAREDSMFLEALRKLAALSGTGNKELDQYVERLEEIEKQF